MEIIFPPDFPDPGKLVISCLDQQPRLSPLSVYMLNNFNNKIKVAVIVSIADAINKKLINHYFKGIYDAI